MRLTEDELNRILSGNPGLKVKTSTTPAGKRDMSKLQRDDFDSEAEWRYYLHRIQAGVLTGIIAFLEIHKTFVVLDAMEHCGRKYKAREYTPDFVVHYADGAVEVIEVKGKQIKKMRPDYSIRKHLFIMRYCNPNKWKFIEAVAEEL